MASKIGVSTWSLQQATCARGMGIEEMIETIAQMGVEGLDFYNEYIPCYPALDLPRLNRILKKCRECGLPVSSTWFMCDIAAACEASSREAVLELIERYLAVTAACGCEFMTFPLLFNVPGLGGEEHYERLLGFFERALPVAERYKVRFAHECPRQGTPELALRLHRALDSDFYTICPDLETWRLETPDIPLVHAEMEAGEKCVPADVALFRECLPYSPVIHFKLLALDEEGEEPHFPIKALMDAINESPLVHHLAIEYEGWIPDICPHWDAVAETRRCVELIRRYQK